MTATLLIIRRELESRKAVFVAAAFAGLLTMAAPLLPWISADSADDARLAMAMVFAVAFTGGTAIAYGATMVATDLRERRLGFYFARPLSGTAIWGGKLLAGLLLALGAGFLAGLPATLMARDSLTGWFESGTVPFVVAGTLLLLGVAHLVAVVIASRSRLVAVDLVALAIVAGCVTLIVRRIAGTHALGNTVLAVSALAVAALLLILAAGWAQVVAGRCDPVRGHRVQSAVLWGGLGLTVALLGGLTAFVLSATPASLGSVDGVLAGDDGSWVAVQGPARWRGDYRPAFLVDTASGRFLDLPSWGQWRLPVRFAADGRRAIWLDADAPNGRSPIEVMTADLTVPTPTPRPTRIFLEGPLLRETALSPDGTRFASVNERQVTVYDLADGRLLATTLLEATGTNPRLVFVDSERLRVELWRDLEAGPDRHRGDLSIASFDVASGRYDLTARVELDLVRSWFRPLDPTAQRMVLIHRTGSGVDLVLHDAWSGAPLATLLSSQGLGPPRVLFLADGRIAFDASGAGAARLRVVDRDGRHLADRDLGPGCLVIPVSEIAPGRALVRIRSTDYWDPRETRDRRSVVVNLDSGSIQPLAAAWIPARASRWSWWRTDLPRPGSLASRLVLNPNGGLEALDPDTGATTHLLGPS